MPLMNGRHRRPEQDDTREQLTPGATELPADLTDRHAVVAKLPPRSHPTLLVDERLERWRGEHQASIGDEESLTFSAEAPVEIGTERAEDVDHPTSAWGA